MADAIATIHIPTFNWKALDNAFKVLILAIDSNNPIEGAGIRLTSHGRQGVEIARSDMAQPPEGPNKDTPPLSQITVKDVTWLSVVTVDPVSCAQTTISVLAQKTGSMVTLNLV